MEHWTSSSPLWTASRDDLRTRRASRAARQSLKRELASYTTSAELGELNAILNRSDPEAAAQIRALIHRRRVA